MAHLLTLCIVASVLPFGCRTQPALSSPSSGVLTDRAAPASVALTTSQSQPSLEAPSESLQDLAARLQDTTLSEESRLAAARSLLAASDSACATLAQLSGEPAVFEILARAALDDPHLVVALLACTQAESVAEQPALALIDVAGSLHEKPAAHALVHMLDANESIATAAMQALSKSTGLTALDTPDAWRRWWDAHRDIPDDAWTSTLIQELSQHASELERRVRRLDRLALDAYRRLYIVTATEARSALLAELLGSELPTLRSLGFELADRELAANATLDPSVAAAAIALLSSADPKARAGAARLVSRLAPPEGAEPVIAALERETVASAAEPLLAAAARWPNPRTIAPVLRWLNDPATVATACQAAITLHEHGLLVGDEHLEQVRRALLPLPTRPSPERLQLLCRIGTMSDRKAIAALLGSEDQSLQRAAADALARLDDSAALLIERAVSDPTIAPLALAALATHARLGAADAAQFPLDAWENALTQASTARAKALLAQQILIRSDGSLTEERRAELEALVHAGGG